MNSKASARRAKRRQKSPRRGEQTKLEEAFLQQRLMLAARDYAEAVNVLKDFRLKHNILPRDTYAERATLPATSHTTGPETMYMVTRNGAPQAVWPPETRDQP